MNIAIFTDTYPPFINGVSTSCYNLALILKRNGHNVLVIAPRTDDGPFEFVDGVVRLPGVEMKKLYGYRLTKFFDHKVMKIVKEFKPDIIHNQTDSTIGFFAKIAAKQLKIPLIYTYHTSYEDYTYYAAQGLMERFAKKFVRAYSKGVAKNADEFITPSEKTMEYMRDIGSDVYMNIIPTGIDFSLFKEDKIDKTCIEEFKVKYGITENTKVFLILGRVAKEKSMDISIRGYAKYKQKHPKADTRLIVVGNGPQKAELEMLASELGVASSTIFIGAVPASEVPFYYHLADIYTSASITETQGLTFMEAMAAGDIVLARYDTNLSNTIVDGKTGFFFISEDNFVEKVETIFSLKEKELQNVKNNAYEIVDTYSIDKFYDNVMGVYKRAIRKYW